MKYMTAYMQTYRALYKEGFGPVISCACGCGKTFRKYDGHNKRERRYASGHNDKRACSELTEKSING